MRNLLFLILLLKFQIVFSQQPDPDFSEKMAFGEARSFLKSVKFTESTSYAGYDLVYQRLSLEVDPAVNYISGSVLSRVKFLKENIEEIHFDLATELIVDSIHFNRNRIDFMHQSNKISVKIPEIAAKQSLRNRNFLSRSATANRFWFVYHLKTPKCSGTLDFVGTLRIARLVAMQGKPDR